ncbi:MAG: hypothetical protein ABIO70_14305 [Pseudomonadota bacterium]
MLALLLVSGALAASAAQDRTVGLGLQLGVPPALSVQINLPKQSALELAVRPPMQGRFQLFDPVYMDGVGYSNEVWIRARWLVSPSALVEFPGDRGAELRWYSGAGLLAYFWTGSEDLALGVQIPLGLSFEPGAVPLQLWADLDLRSCAGFPGFNGPDLRLGSSFGARWFF